MLEFLIALIVLGAILYVVSLLPIDGTIKRVIQIIAIVFICIWALKVLWPMAGLG